MRLLEFQAKRIFSKNGIAVPKSMLITSPEDIQNILLPSVLKAQIPVGGRGKAGAIRKVETTSEAESVVAELLGSTVKGFQVQALLAEEPVEVKRELYLSYLADKQANRPLLMASLSGGVDIEEVAKTSPQRIIKKYIDPLLGLKDYTVRSLAKALEIDDFPSFNRLVGKILTLSQGLDATLVEINPLAETREGLVALDAKMLLDDQASYRHNAFFGKMQLEQKKLDKRAKSRPVEMAEKRNISYVPLEGDIGLIADGAGTGMLTLDMIHDAGGRPANFCEMGGMANDEIMQRTMEVILADERVKVLLISLIGGLTRMDEMAKGIVRYLQTNESSVPIVIRMCGTKSEVGLAMLKGVGLDAYEDLAATVQTAVKKAKEL